MQIKKAGAVATGALATLAVMGAPAAAATHTDLAAMTQASMLNLAKAGPMGAAQPLIVAGDGSVVNGAAWQACGGIAVWGVGGVVTTGAPNTVLGACNNGNVKLKLDTPPPLVGALNDTVIAAATWQVCGSTTVAGVGGSIAIQNANTVVGGCRNGNIDISEDNDYTESTTVAEALTKATATKVQTRKADVQKTRTAWAARGTTAARAPRQDPMEHPMGLVSVGSGSAVQAATWQVCGSAAVAGVGGTIVAQSPNTLWGDCDNANVHIAQPDWPQHLISVLDYTSINLAPWQACGSSVMGGIGGTINIQSPNTVYGDCNNANTVID